MASPPVLNLKWAYNLPSYQVARQFQGDDRPRISHQDESQVFEVRRSFGRRGPSYGGAVPMHDLQSLPVPVTGYLPVYHQGRMY